jgi:hypothetical protein
MPKQKQNKPKIISISTLPPNYELFAQAPGFCYLKNSFRKLGWNNGLSDLLNLLPTEILRQPTNLQSKVWHPDLRADKIYSHNVSEWFNLQGCFLRRAKKSLRS